MDELKMFTQEEVCELLHSNINTVSMLREVGILRATKTGRNFMFSKYEILRFQHLYAGCDVSNKVKAIKCKELVEGNTNNMDEITKNIKEWRN